MTLRVPGHVRRRVRAAKSCSTRKRRTSCCTVRSPPRALLWAKVARAGRGLAVARRRVQPGRLRRRRASPRGRLAVPPRAHPLARLEALFCTGCVVLVYQLCLRWFGRERLDGLMTTVQVVMAVRVAAADRAAAHRPLRIESHFSRILVDRPPAARVVCRPRRSARRPGRRRRVGPRLHRGCGHAAVLAGLRQARARYYRKGLQTLGEARRSAGPGGPAAGSSASSSGPPCAGGCASPSPAPRSCSPPLISSAIAR